MALVISSCGTTSFGWEMRTCILCSQKVRRDENDRILLHIYQQCGVFLRHLPLLPLPTSLPPEGKNLVKIDLMDWAGQRSYAFYENFRITDEAVR